MTAACAGIIIGSIISRMRPLGACLALLLAAGVCACSRDARPDKVVNIYNWADYIGKDTLAQFEQETGIRVVYDTYDADETLEAKMMAGDSGYDVVSTSTDYFSRQIKAGIYQPLDKSRLPGWKNLDPQVLKRRSGGRSRQPACHAVPAARQRLCLQHRPGEGADAGCAGGQPRHVVQTARSLRGSPTVGLRFSTRRKMFCSSR